MPTPDMHLQLTHADMDDESLVAACANLLDSERALREKRTELEYELQARLLQRRATQTVPNADGKYAELMFGPDEYLHDRLMALGEVVPPQFFNRGYVPAHETTVPAKFNMVQVNMWARMFGDPVIEIMDTARLPGSKRGKIRIKTSQKEATC
jgi:hypothetical protein